MSLTITLLTLTETAQRLRKSDSQLRWMIHNGSAPKSALIGGRRMFRESDIEAFIAEAFDTAVA
jgi:excisionase family DNA binding protein